MYFSESRYNRLSTSSSVPEDLEYDKVGIIEFRYGFSNVNYLMGFVVICHST